MIPGQKSEKDKTQGHKENRVTERWSGLYALVEHFPGQAWNRTLISWHPLLLLKSTVFKGISLVVSLYDTFPPAPPKELKGTEVPWRISQCKELSSLATIGLNTLINVINCHHWQPSVLRVQLQHSRNSLLGRPTSALKKFTSATFLMDKVRAFIWGPSDDPNSHAGMQGEECKKMVTNPTYVKWERLF